MKAKQTSGYSADLAKIYISDETEILLLSTELQKQFKWVDGKPTDEIAGYKVLCGIPNDFFFVKFDKKVAIPQFGSKVKLKGLQACEVEKSVYFRAEDIEEVK